MATYQLVRTNAAKPGTNAACSRNREEFDANTYKFVIFEKQKKLRLQ